MKSEVLNQFPHTWLICAALLLFFLVFLAVLFSAFKPANQQTYSLMSKIPFESGDDI